MFHDNEWPWSLVKGDDDWDWYALRGANGGYVSDACVEGDAEEWRQMATAIEMGLSCSFKRCRVSRDSNDYLFSSPRNTMGRVARVGCDKALQLVDIIRDAIAGTEGNRE